MAPKYINQKNEFLCYLLNIFKKPAQIELKRAELLSSQEMSQPKAKPIGVIVEKRTKTIHDNLLLI